MLSIGGKEPVSSFSNGFFFFFFFLLVSELVSD